LKASSLVALPADEAAMPVMAKDPQRTFQESEIVGVGAVVEVPFSDKKEGVKYYPGKVHMPGPASLRPEELSFPRCEGTKVL
jgi:hypothetical protein